MGLFLREAGLGKNGTRKRTSGKVALADPTVCAIAVHASAIGARRTPTSYIAAFQSHTKRV